MDKFTLQHTVLYAKGWYKKSEDFWSDIKKCLTADGYSGDLFSIKNCSSLILSQLENLPKSHYNSLSVFITEIQEYNCWKHGYVTKVNDWSNKSIEEYNFDKAIVKYCLSVFGNLEKGKWTSCKPDFNKCLPKANGISDKKIKEMFEVIT